MLCCRLSLSSAYAGLLTADYIPAVANVEENYDQKHGNFRVLHELVYREVAFDPIQDLVSRLLLLPCPPLSHTFHLVPDCGGAFEEFSVRRVVYRRVQPWDG